MAKTPGHKLAFDNPAGAKAEICERLACGESLASICRDKHTPGLTLVYAWLRDDPQFAKDYARARETQADSDADAINDIAAKVLTGEVEPNAARVAIDALKWTAGRRLPKKYGDKLAIGGADDLPPVQTLNVTALSDEALREILAATNGQSDDS